MWIHLLISLVISNVVINIIKKISHPGKYLSSTVSIKVFIDRNLEKKPTTFLVGEVPLLSGYELNLGKHDRKSNTQVLKQDDEVYVVFHEVFRDILLR